MREVDRWIEIHLKGLSSAQIAPIFNAAIQAVLNRTLVTLSEVTLNAVLDRVVSQCQKKHPRLTGLRVESFQISSEGLSHPTSEDLAEVIEAYRFLLIELLTILENLTAGIIMEPLYRELSMVSSKNDMKSSSDRGNK